MDLWLNIKQTFKGHRPSANLGEEGKTFSVLVHSFLLSDGANSGFTLSITPLR